MDDSTVSSTPTAGGSNPGFRPPVFLIGYMGCGKTTFGRALARRLERDFIDLDFYIEQRFRTTVQQLFAEKGEEEFRRIEREMLHEAGEFSDVIVACGGGTPCFFDNMDFIKSHGISVWLDTTPERILQRVRKKLSKRPLLACKSDDELTEFVAGNMAEREPFYSRADIRTDSYHLENTRQINSTIDAFLSLHNV